MAGAQGRRMPLPPLWLWCWAQVLLDPLGQRPAQALNLDSNRPTIYAGPDRSYFGFAVDFPPRCAHSMSVVVGAPRANTSQPGVMEAGAVYLCPWAPGKNHCSLIEFDPKGLQKLKNYKSHQWFGASVNSWNGNIVVGVPGGRAIWGPALPMIVPTQPGDPLPCKWGQTGLGGPWGFPEGAGVSVSQEETCFAPELAAFQYWVFPAPWRYGPGRFGCQGGQGRGNLAQ
uniref:Uncharacterized protein n=1 Tax=Pelusios castaneus TaxID=367368 RepID=A0A8C8STC5_9SAUR